MTLEFRVLTGAEIEARLDDLAGLRIEVFREFPYLYDGDLAYEATYLSTYRDSPKAILVGAFDGAKLVGAATGTPMEDHADDFGQAFAGTEYELKDIFYCAESVLLPAYRGQGAGHAFFEAREAHARVLERRFSAFCAVIRPGDHRLRPKEYRPLDGFWKKRGYRQLHGVISEFEWKDIDQPEATKKPLQFWLRALAPS